MFKGISLFVQFSFLLNYYSLLVLIYLFWSLIYFLGRDFDSGDSHPQWLKCPCTQWGLAPWWLGFFVVVFQFCGIHFICLVSIYFACFLDLWLKVDEDISLDLWYKNDYQKISSKSCLWRLLNIMVWCWTSVYIFFVEKYKTNNPIECFNINGLLNIFFGARFKIDW